MQPRPFFNSKILNNLFRTPLPPPPVSLKRGLKSSFFLSAGNDFQRLFFSLKSESYQKKSFKLVNRKHDNGCKHKFQFLYLVMKMFYSHKLLLGKIQQKRKVMASIEWFGLQFQIVSSRIVIKLFLFIQHTLKFTHI